ncbi:MAG: trypsin-like peptidase domain-containing protein, partial [Anaerolineae bacterium]|nr:trypsin-like peptidase domain-containing protein [Anaerolineae bacterium]
LNLTDDEQRLARLYEQISPSVVSINVVAQESGSSSLFPEEEGFAFGSGSGFVIDQQGHIVTNNHVVDGATRIEINFYDGTLTRGEIVGVDPDSDLAVLQVDLPSENLHPVMFGNSNNLVIGQSAIAIGSPFGERWTLTTGVISALDRRITGLNNYAIGSVIQTDAAINPGNSGGPLFNLNGEVIGVNSQIRSRTRSNSGIGYAIPSNLVQRVANEMLTSGRVNYSYLGISGDDVNLALIETLDLPNNTRGVVVDRVEPGGPAAQAGLRNPGNRQIVEGSSVPSSADIITAINGEAITDFSALIGYLASNTRPGDTVNLTVLRDGQAVQLSLTLSSRP